MAEIGYALSCEEHPANDLVRHARRAEEAGFTFALISDHYHPWIDRQGQSPFVWSVIGGIAQVTQRLRLGTGVTCPTVRIHPAVIAQAAATAATMMPGRFFLGVGSGENLNEHILGDPWPGAGRRLEMLEEAIGVIRLLWEGGYQSFQGAHFEVDNARIYSLPETPPPIYMAAAGPKATKLAAEIADGFIGTAPEADLLQAFASAGGASKPTYGQTMVCFDPDEERARQIAHEWWPTAAIKGELGQELPLPRHFEQAAEMVSVDDVAEVVPCGSDPQVHIDNIRKYIDAGYDNVYVHQIGQNQDAFFDFYESEVLPKLR